MGNEGGRGRRRRIRAVRKARQRYRQLGALRAATRDAGRPFRKEFPVWNIAEAKNQIADTVEGYLTRDETGAYLIAPEAQRPLFLLGAPGIGKTAVVGQVARELGIGLVSYSMTHHTRQSALGLPFIVHKRYGEEEFDISEYTMSEIIAIDLRLPRENRA